MTKKQSILTFIFLIFLCSISYADEIHLIDGRIIKTQTCWTENNKVYYQKYGGTVSLPDEKVLKIIQSNDLVENSVSSNSDKITTKKHDKRSREALKNCYDKCENTKILCIGKNYKDKKNCLIDKRICRLNCEIDFKMGKVYNFSWSEKKDKLEKSHKAKIKMDEKKLAEIKNTPDEKWKKRCKQHNEGVKRGHYRTPCFSWKELKEKSIKMYERRIEKWKKMLAKVGVLDLNQIDLKKFSKKAKNDRKNRIEKEKLSAARNYVNCQYDKDNREPNTPTGGWYSCKHSHESEKILWILIRIEIDLQNSEKAFFEELGIDLEAEAEKSIAMN